MTRLTFLLAVIGASACSPTATPDATTDAQESAVLRVPGMASYIGVWESDDAQVRQTFLIADAGSAVQACMLAPDEAGNWQTVSEGRYVAEGDTIAGEFTGAAMGFESLSVVGYPVGGDGGVDWVNTAMTSDGEQVTYETWAAPGGGVFTYVIERGEGIERELWFAGQWRFRGDVEARCE